MVEKTIDKRELTVIVPIYNEANALPDFLPNLVAKCGANKWVAILIDDGSTDDSVDILTRYKNHPFCQVVFHKVNRGYGGVLKTGIAYTQTEYAVTIDSDGQHDIADIEKVYDFAGKKDADTVIGDRGRWKSANP